MLCLLYISCLLVVGYPAVQLLTCNRSPTEILGLSACVGPGIMGLLLIFLSMLGIKPSLLEILVIAIPFLVASILLLKKGKNSSHQITPSSIERFDRFWITLCGTAILYGLLVMILSTLVYPTLEWDAFAIWQLKAKVLATLPLTPRPAYFTDLSLSYSHLRYPLLVPMISAGLHAVNGTLDGFEKAPSLLFICGLAATLFSAVYQRAGRNIAFMSLALLLNVIPMYRYAGSGTAEMGLTAFYGCSIVCMLHWQDKQRLGDLILLSFLSACMAWTKNEGLALAAINAIVLLFVADSPWRKRLVASATCAFVVAILYLPWLIWSHGLPRTDEDYASKLNLHEILAGIHRLPVILGAFGAEFLTLSSWGILWILLPAVTILQWKEFRRRSIALLAVMLLLHLLAYIPPLMIVQNWNLEELLHVTTDRLTLHTLPAALLLLSMLWPRWIFPASPTPIHESNELS